MRIVLPILFLFLISTWASFAQLQDKNANKWIGIVVLHDDSTHHSIPNCYVVLKAKDLYKEIPRQSFLDKEEGDTEQLVLLRYMDCWPNRDTIWMETYHHFEVLETAVCESDPPLAESAVLKLLRKGKAHVYTPLGWHRMPFRAKHHIYHEDGRRYSKTLQFIERKTGRIVIESLVRSYTKF